MFDGQATAFKARFAAHNVGRNGDNGSVRLHGHEVACLCLSRQRFVKVYLDMHNALVGFDLDNAGIPPIEH